MHLSPRTTLTAFSILLMTGSVMAKPLEPALVPRSDKTWAGCYSGGEGLTNKTTYQYQSSGWCETHCSDDSYLVFGLFNGKQCWCGMSLPPSSDKVEDSKCDKECAGYPSEMCGGSSYYSVYTTGVDDDKASAAASSTTASATAATTDSAGQTKVVTAAADTSNADSGGEKSKGGPNKAAIAAGTVVGVVGAAAVAGAAFFFWRSRKQKAQGFNGTNGDYPQNTQQPMSDSRFDGQFMAQRRQSNGSIDDDHDFSRRILQVTNPDR